MDSIDLLFIIFTALAFIIAILVCVICAKNELSDLATKRLLHKIKRLK